MTDTPTPEAVAAILKDVTPGPWNVQYWATGEPHSIRASYACINGLSASFALAHIAKPDEATIGMTDGAFNAYTSVANARFIEWARNNIEALAADLAAQKARADEWQSEAIAHARKGIELTHRAEAAEAKVAKLVEALRRFDDDSDCHESGEWFEDRLREARAAIAEVQG